MRFGANYTPRRGWFHHWLDFDIDEQREDFEALAGLGLDHVRVFCLWPVFQPQRGMIRQRALDDLARMVEVAGETGLDVTVDVLQGHLSSFDFYPAWTSTHHHRNVFTDLDVIEAQAELVAAVATRLTDVPGYLGLGLANEPNNLLTRDPAGEADIDAWVGRLLAAADQADPRHPSDHSAYDAVWYDDDHPFTPRQLTTMGARTVIHPWVFSGGIGATYGGLSTEATHVAEYVVELARAWAPDPRRPIWVQEIGAPVGSVAPGDAPEFAERTLRAIARCEGVWGVTWWCSHDVGQQLKDFPELEYSLGLCDNAGHAKPVGERIRDVVADLRATPPVVATRPTGLVLDVTDQPRRASGPGGALFKAWMGQVAAGQTPAIVTSDRAHDAAYLASRGITDVRTV
jgi:hypothetical protein